MVFNLLRRWRWLQNYGTGGMVVVHETQIRKISTNIAEDLAQAKIDKEMYNQQAEKEAEKYSKSGEISRGTSAGEALTQDQV